MMIMIMGKKVKEKLAFLFLVVVVFKKKKKTTGVIFTFEYLTRLANSLHVQSLVESVPFLFFIFELRFDFKFSINFIEPRIELLLSFR